MLAGPLDRRVLIESRSDPGSFGGAPSWSTVVTTWAEKVQQTGREYFGAARDTSEVRVVWRVRYRSSITPGMRLTYAGDVYDIEEVREMGRREGLQLHCRAVV